MVAGVWVSPRMGPSWELGASLAHASGCDGWSWPTLVQQQLMSETFPPG
ncbi:hypothetical protein RISK_006193 [Rhodopirellula islandica]|uniref:Uncharacterized protein n=1 Tax=Rhodopirellula islandica TaxID=595434 RepID=A0A0J1E8B7_RHOIS|nr:hypothetical protein RISK_006193 [Rhodopirellula islandica]